MENACLYKKTPKIKLSSKVLLQSLNKHPGTIDSKNDKLFWLVPPTGNGIAKSQNTPLYQIANPQPSSIASQPPSLIPPTTMSASTSKKYINLTESTALTTETCKIFFSLL